jgi:hypothetical protein
MKKNIMLSKIIISNKADNLSKYESELSHPTIIKSIKLINEPGTYFTDCNYTVIYKSNNNDYKLINIINNSIKLIDEYYRIPILFHKKLIWKSINSFDQNNINIANSIRKTIINELKYFQHKRILEHDKQLIGIGGEYYGYFSNLTDCYNNFIGITNNKSIMKDTLFNNNIYNINIKNYLINDYNDKRFQITKLLSIDKKYDCIVNLSKINENIAKQLNILKKEKLIDTLIIISCNKKNEKNILKYFKQKKIYWFLNINNSYIKILVC